MPHLAEPGARGGAHPQRGRVGGLEVGELLDLVRKELRVDRIGKQDARAAKAVVAKAWTRDSARVLAKRASEIDGELRNPDLADVHKASRVENGGLEVAALERGPPVL